MLSPSGESLIDDHSVNIEIKIRMIDLNDNYMTCANSCILLYVAESVK